MKVVIKCPFCGKEMEVTPNIVKTVKFDISLKAKEKKKA